MREKIHSTIALRYHWVHEQVLYKNQTIEGDLPAVRES